MLSTVGMPVIEDNQSAVQLALNPIPNSNSKHINVRHHFLRKLVGRNEILIIRVPSHFQHLDFLTKATSRESFEFHRSLAMDLR